MPFTEYSMGCGDCTNTTTEDEGKYRITIQTRWWQHSTTNSTFDMAAQPDTGFMYYMNKESTMVMLLSNYTNPDQAL